MDRHRRDGTACLEEILLHVESLVALARISPSPSEKDIHREIREAFTMKTRAEQLVASISTLYSAILEMQALKEERDLWRAASNPSPAQKARRKNQELLQRLLSDLPPLAGSSPALR